MITHHEEIELQRELHQSNNSKVFSAVSVKTGKKFAVKVLNEVFPSPEMIARFNEEAELSRRFEIEGLRKIWGRQKIDNRHALVMEFIEGFTLHQLIAEKQIDIPYFIKLAIRTATIIAEIHKYGLIHKDINPRNFILNNQENKIYLIDLGIATLSKKEYQQFQAPDKLEGTLAYISPEQTGRVNHAIDTRSDLYSLGITFYEMLTGYLPFASADSMELVHSHIAKTPETPLHKNPKIPPILSKIVMKLIEKDVYERYQTALGLRADLEYCLKILTEKGEQALQNLDFELAKKDILNRFQIPEKLYGRENERKLLLDTFAEVQNGTLACVMVSGYSGIGKTALIKELYKPVTEQRGYFLSGKFEQFQRDIPYSAFISALNTWIRQLLGESEKRLTYWKKEIIEALENNAGVLTEVVPSLELIIGKQASPSPLPPVENQNRFNHVLQNFFKNISTEKHPLVVFIDDWQWADLPSLNLFRLLTTDSENQYLCWIAAYRDNEVDAAHPFTAVLQDIQKSTTKFIDLKIKELEKKHLVELLQDTLLVSEVESLAELLMSKTSGNPFFTTQFLQNLYESGYINYDYELKQWTWNIQHIEALPISNNVLDLMTSRLYTLAPATQKLLALASCIGNYFPLKLLSELARQSQIEVRWTLLQALEEGFLLPHQGSHYSIEDENDQGVYFRFLHDRVEQAANKMLSAKEFKEKQSLIGLIILEKYPEEYISENLFDLVNYLNNGQDFIESESEKRHLAELNYRAGKKAKRSAAYSAASSFFETAVTFFPSNFWEQDYAKAFDLYKELGETEFLKGNFENSDRYLELCLNQAQNNLDKAEVYKIKIAQFSGQGKYSEAVQMAISAVTMFGIYLPNLNEEARFQEVTGEEIGRYWVFISEKGVQSLGELPDCQDQNMTVVMDILNMALDCAVMGTPNAFPLLAMKISNLGIQYGLSDSVTTCFVFNAIIHVAVFKDFKGAYQISHLACQLGEKRKEAYPFLPKIYTVYSYYSYLEIPLRESAVFLQKGHQKGVEVGDFVYASYATSILCRFLIGLNIQEGLEKCLESIVFLKRVNNIPILLLTNMCLGFVRCMQGQSRRLGSFDCEELDEQFLIDTFSVSAPTLFGVYKRYKLQAMYLLGFKKEAWDLVEERASWIAYVGGLDIGLRSEYYLYSGLTASALYSQTENAEEKANYEAVLDECRSEIDLLLACTDNFLPIHLILKAEKARIQNDKLLALETYDLAIREAEKREIPQYVGLAAERAALFFLDWHKKDFAKIYFQKALYAYQTWGAEAKVKQLKEQYPEFWFLSSYSAAQTGTIQTSQLTTIRPSVSMGSNRSESLDFLSVMKASQAISQEIKLEALLRKMITILMENAGAERALLIQEQDSELLIAAEANLQSAEIDLMRKLSLEDKSSEEYLALKIVRTVHRTQEAIVIDQAQRDQRLVSDSYIKQSQVKSILCMPIIHQGKTRLVIYMEHRQISGAFTQSRVDILKMLSAQVAISIENSMLYDTLEQKVGERTADLAQANYQLKDKNIRLTDSINYALTMQQAILPVKSDWQDFFADSFILYLPKDIVSGDFYWYAQVDKYFVLAVIDCTGHGVPGAFMSMIANTLVNEIVKQKRIVDPAKVLETLHQGVRETLNQQNTNNTDGMDLAFCTIEAQEKQFYLHFSGAKNNLYYHKQGEMRKLDGDRRSIGGKITKNESPFTIQTLVLEKGDSIYLSTDGYTDQAGGAERHSFTKKRLLIMLQEIAHLPMVEQENRLLQALQNHQNGQAQRDDITVLGIKL